MNISEKITEAAKFIIELLAKGEVPSKEVTRLAEEAGIARRTFDRARKIIGVKSRKERDEGWYLSIPDDGKEYTTEDISALETKIAQESSEKRQLEQSTRQISTDWLSVVTVTDDKIDVDEGILGQNVPGSVLHVPGSVLRIKVGAYEIEASDTFPIERLVELPDRLEAKRIC